MSTVTPTTTSPPAAPTAAASITPVEATVTGVPDKIAQLIRQIQVSGTISEPPTASSIVLSTALGEITLDLSQVLLQTAKQKLLQQLMQAFDSQRPLTAVVQAGSPPTQAVLLLPSLPSAVSAATELDTISLAQTFATPSQPLTPGTVLSAVVLPPETGNAFPASPVSTLPSLVLANIVEAETVLPATILPPATAQAEQNIIAELPGLLAANKNAPLAPEPVISQPNFPAPTLNLPNTPALANPLPAGTPPLPATPAVPLNQPLSNQPIPLQSLLQPGKEVILTVNNITLPSAPPLAATAPNQIVATVIGNSPNGQLILKAGDTVLYVRQSAEAPVGSNLLLTVDTARPALLPEIDQQGFASLQQLFAALAQADPQLAQQLFQSNVPQLNAQLPTALLFFLSAFKQGDVRGWLGNNAADILDRMGKFELITKLAQDMPRLGQPAHDGVVGEWRSYPVPLHADGRFQILNFYIHGDSHGKSARDNARPGSSQVRFLIDMRMSRLGPIQLDGLVQPKKLDMIVRSESALPGGLPHELRDSYIRTLGALDYAGSLNFQIGRQHWLVIQREGQKSVVT